jgi:hypothetical protein
MRDPDHIHPRATRQRPGLPEDGHPDVHEGWRQVSRPQTPALHRAGAEVLAENVYALNEPPQESLPFPKPKVESNALAPSALDRPHERVPVVERAQAAEELTYAWLFHLNDVCPELTQRAGAEGRGDTRADIEHPEPVKGGEWACHVVLRPVMNQ